MDSLSQRLESMSPLQRAVFALKETQARLEMLERQRSEPIAIVGMACRFPGGVCDATSFWRALCSRMDAIREIPPDHWDVDEFFDPDPAAPGKMNTRWAGIVDRIGDFAPRRARSQWPDHGCRLAMCCRGGQGSGWSAPPWRASPRARS